MPPPRGSPEPQPPNSSPPFRRTRPRRIPPPPAQAALPPLWQGAWGMCPQLPQTSEGGRVGPPNAYRIDSPDRSARHRSFEAPIPRPSTTLQEKRHCRPQAGSMGGRSLPEKKSQGGRGGKSAGGVGRIGASLFPNSAGDTSPYPLPPPSPTLSPCPPIANSHPPSKDQLSPRSNAPSKSGWPLCFAPPLQGPCVLSGTRSALPLRGLRFLPGPRDSIPRLANECKAGPGLPWALKRGDSKLRRFLRDSSPVAGPRSSRHGRAGKTRDSNSMQFEPPPVPPVFPRLRPAL